MRAVNMVMLIGNLGRDPEVRTMQNGDKVANISLATSDRWKTESGEKKEKTEWHRVVAFKGLAEIAERFLRKGSKVFIMGSLQTRKWKDKDDQERYSTEVVLNSFFGQIQMLDSKEDRGGDSSRGDEWGTRSGGGERKSTTEIQDDEIPF